MCTCTSIFPNLWNLLWNLLTLKYKHIRALVSWRSVGPHLRRFLTSAFRELSMADPLNESLLNLIVISAAQRCEFHWQDTAALLLSLLTGCDLEGSPVESPSAEECEQRFGELSKSTGPVEVQALVERLVSTPKVYLPFRLYPHSEPTFRL